MSNERPDIAFGIDLGTTFCAVSFRAGTKTEQMLFPAVGAQLPSAVFWSSGGTHQIGQAALNQAFKDPASLHTHFKRGIPDRPDAPWNGTSGPTPMELSAELLRGMWSVIRQTHPEVLDYIPEFNGSKPADRLQIILTHPATYRQDQVRTLQQVVDAVGDGFRVDGFITEPVAAGLVYRQQHSLNQGDHIAVFDMGGGTFDTCVLKFDAGMFEPVTAGKGDATLGGLNFSGALFGHFCKELGQDFPCFDPERGLNLSPTQLSPAERRLASKIWAAADEIKIQLSTIDNASVYIETPGGLRDLTLDRQQFTDICATPDNLWDRFDACARDVLSGTQLTWSDIDGVALVGGSAMVPGLREQLAKITERPVEDVFRSPDSTHVVANGAAYQAYVRENTGQCFPGGLAVQLRDGNNGNSTYRYRFFFKTGEIVPASGTTVQQLGQMIDSSGGRG